MDETKEENLLVIHRIKKKEGKENGTWETDY